MSPSLATPAGQDNNCMMHVLIDAARIHQFRQLAVTTCGELLTFMRIQPMAHATRMKVSLLLKKSASERLMDIIMRTLPDAEFGRIQQFRPTSAIASFPHH